MLRSYLNHSEPRGFHAPIFGKW
ncbi:hypothetical protein CY0110_17697 [Crocosphaera chwakensis CCY0110]|uniref:Uncharacterized protein n=1 Tax=Crocosphaera chwakensis CCY0110 TaxID=391612 RepID=A3IIM1_9CHRO|nr:hypothetical protein CY0110_17697 [Crocosphaera chwakensis CCY0110]